MVSRAPFPEAVALEKDVYRPLPENASASSRLRRRFFQGHWLGPDDGVALGGTKGLLGAAIRLMEDWGFKFESQRTAAGIKEFRMLNPEHVPIEAIRRQRGPARSRGKSATPAGPPEAMAVREKLLSGDDISCAESMAMGVSSAFVRKEVSRLQDIGYRFHITGHGMDRTYRMTKVPRDPEDSQPKGKALVKAPTAKVAPSNGNGHATSTQQIQDMLFGELTTPAPRFGGAVRVIGLMLDESDEHGEELVLALRGGNGTWTTM